MINACNLNLIQIEILLLSNCWPFVCCKCLHLPKQHSCCIMWKCLQWSFHKMIFPWNFEMDELWNGHMGHFTKHELTWISLGMHYNVTASLIGWAHTYFAPWAHNYDLVKIHVALILILIVQLVFIFLHSNTAELFSQMLNCYQLQWYIFLIKATCILKRFVLRARKMFVNWAPAVRHICATHTVSEKIDSYISTENIPAVYTKLLIKWNKAEAWFSYVFYEYI